MQVREKILVLLDSWQEAFGGSEGKHSQYYFAYTELKRSGVRFPEKQIDAAALTYSQPTQTTNHPQVGNGMPTNSIERLDEVMGSDMGNLCLSDLHNIRGVMGLFINMLQAVNPEDHGAIKDEVVIDITNQCRMYQRRLMELTSSTENERLLEETLALNDNLQVVLAKYDAISSGLPLPTEKFHPQLRPSAPPSAPTLISQFEEKEEEEEDDGFDALAKRESKFISNVDLELSQSSCDLTSATSTTSALEGSSSSTSNALVLFNPQEPVNTPKKEEDMIHQSLVLVTDQSPQTPPLPPPASNLNQDSFSASPGWQKYTSYPQLPNYTVPPMANEGYIPYNSYIAPWAQPAFAQSVPPAPVLPQNVPEYQYSYLPPYFSTGASVNPFLSIISDQNPGFQSQITADSAVTTAAIQDSKALQKFDMFGSKETQTNTNSEKHFMPDKLFDDLIALRNPDGSLNPLNASTLWDFSGQGLTIGRR